MLFVISLHSQLANRSVAKLPEVVHFVYIFTVIFTCLHCVAESLVSCLVGILSHCVELFCSLTHGYILGDV